MSRSQARSSPRHHLFTLRRENVETTLIDKLEIPRNAIPKVKFCQTPACTNPEYLLLLPKTKKPHGLETKNTKPNRNR